MPNCSRPSRRRRSPPSLSTNPAPLNASGWCSTTHPAPNAAARLLVGRGHEDDVAVERHLGAVQREKRLELDDAERLGVERRRAPQMSPSLHRRRERILAPVLRVRRHDVHVARSSTSAGCDPPLSRAQMLPRPGADDAVSNAMPSCVKMSAKNCIVSTSLPGGLVVLMRRYSRVRRTASSCTLAMSIDCCAAARCAGERNEAEDRSEA